MSLPRIIFVNRCYFPDTSATSQMLTDLTTSLTGRFDVSVFTSRIGQGDWDVSQSSVEDLHDIKIYRACSTNLGRSNLLRRVLDYISFHIATFFFLLYKVREKDVVILKTDPPLLQLVNTAAIRFKGGVVVNWLQDIYPEIAQLLGSGLKPKWLGTFLGKWRDQSLKSAATNVVLSQPMSQYLIQRGIHNVEVIPNWSNDHAESLEEAAVVAQRQSWGVDNKFVVMYSGNFGRAHTFKEIAQAVLCLKDNNRVQFVLVGEGAGLKPLRESVEKAGCKNVLFLPKQTRENLGVSLAAADLHLVTLKPGMEQFLMPSKLYGALAAGRPVGFVGEGDGYIAELIRSENAGFTVDCGDGSHLAEEIVALANDRIRCQAIGSNARNWFLQEFTRVMAISHWRHLLEKHCQIISPTTSAVTNNSASGR